MTVPRWLTWAKEIQAIAQTGLAFTENVYDKERYHQLQHLAAEIIATHTDIDVTPLREMFEKEAGYATPKVDVRGIVFKEDTLLMVREKMDGGRWTVPGGWADVNTTPAEAVVKEVLEESGYRVRATKILAVYDRNKHAHPPYLFHVYKVFIRCELLSDIPEKATTDYETGEPTFFNEAEIPADISTPRVTAAQIGRFFQHWRQPDLPTDFD